MQIMHSYMMVVHIQFHHIKSPDGSRMGALLLLRILTSVTASFTPHVLWRTNKRAVTTYNPSTRLVTRAEVQRISGLDIPSTSTAGSQSISTQRTSGGDTTGSPESLQRFQTSSVSVLVFLDPSSPTDGGAVALNMHSCSRR